MHSRTKAAKKPTAQPAQPETLKGWKQISAFLGHPSPVVQRWAAEGMRYIERDDSWRPRQRN